MSCTVESFPLFLRLTLLRRKDAIDIDNFAEYEAMAKKIIDEAPSKLSVFFSLDDVKAAAARVGFCSPHRLGSCQPYTTFIGEIRQRSKR